MTETMMSSITLFAAALVLGGSIAALALAWRRALQDERPMLLAPMLERHGVNIADATRRLGGYELALAGRRCASCRNWDECREWLQHGYLEDYKAFCPNAGFVERSAPRSRA